MNEKIEVGYTPAAFVGGLGIHHKYILYTDSDGKQFFARGGPGFFGPGADDGGRNDSSESPFGNIKTRIGPYIPDKKKNPDWDPARDPTNTNPDAIPHPRETIKEGGDLSLEWAKIKETLQRIDDQKIPYDPRSTNSNSTVDEALREASLPAPKMDGADQYWSPGSDFDLPGGEVIGSSDEKKFIEDFDKWINDKLSESSDLLEKWLREKLAPTDQSEVDPLKAAADQKQIDAFLREILPLTMSRGDFWEPLESIKRKTQSASLIPSPIVLDLDGDGVETMSLANGAWFDHAADGFAERTGWASSDDGLLVRDLDGNGSIDSGRELFGSETLLSSGTTAANGFEALKALDTNADGVIDAQDAAFAELRVWKDANGNGRTDAGELLTLAEAGVASINVGYDHSDHVDAQGNAHRQVGSYTTSDGQTRSTADIWVQTNTTQSLPTDWVAVPEDIASLPDAQGYGLVRDLQQAMAMDTTGELKALVEAFIQATTPQDRDVLVTQLIYHWTGVQDVDPYSRASRSSYGNVIGDARKLEALEAFMGEEWVGVWCWGTRDPNPHGRAAPVLLQAWDELKALVVGQLMAQTHLQGLFQQISYHWDEEIEEVVGDLASVAHALAQHIQTDRDAGLVELGDLLYALKGMGLLNRLDVGSFKAQLGALGDDVAQTMNVALQGWTGTNTPSEGDDVLRGTDLDNVIDGRGGNDRFVGRGGNDLLIGGLGNDTLDGGTGNDEMRGGEGSDTYLFGRGDGHDTITENAWNTGEIDRIQLKAGLSADDVRLQRIRTGSGWAMQDDLRLVIRDTGETITVKNHFGDSERNAIEEIVFSDGTVWDTEAIRSQVLMGGVENEELLGYVGRDDVLDGGAGNDMLRGASGSDTYRYGRGDGHDTIVEGTWTPAETDRIELKAGLTGEDIQLQRVRTTDGWQWSDDLRLTIRDTGETLIVKNHFSAD